MTTKTGHPETRREFLIKSSRIGFACGALSFCFCNRLTAGEAVKPIPDPKKLNYCGWSCQPDCAMKLAGESDDVEKKRAAYEMWHVKENHGLDFDPDQIVCHGCKTDSKELGVVVEHCEIRKCAMKKKLDGCIRCDELASCEKFPTDFRKVVLEMQQQYRAAQS